MSELEEYLQSKLSPKRYQHSVNVAAAAVMLAERYGGVDVEKARFAGLVHDICKEDPKDVQYALVLQSEMDVCEEERKSWKVWHGIAGAELLRTEFGVTNLDVLHAVRYHTIGRGGMSRLEQIIYLADMISAERSYADVQVMRKKTMESLESGMRYALKYSLQKLIRREAWIPHHTIDAYHESLAALGQQEG